MEELETMRLDRRSMKVARLVDPPDDREYWWSITPEERLTALETLRQINYGYHPPGPRLLRVLEVVEHPQG
ncbi:MAG: hypothetical protein FJ319_04605 [SAR202 cluster bacterium]|nr:hypothetical protein [SAR202 cluster bacterium]